MSASPSRSWSRKAPKSRAMRPRPSPSTTSRCRRSFRSPSGSAGQPVDLAGGENNVAFRIQARRDRPGRGGDPRRRPCRGMRAGQQPRRGRAAGNTWCARRVRRLERPAAPDCLGRRRARDPRPARRLRISDPEEKLRVSIPDVGGGFGMKNVLYPEWVLVLWAARRLGRPVKWIGDRSEDFARLRAWPRQHRPRSLGAGSGWPLPGARSQRPRQYGRLYLDGGAGRADHGDGQRDGRRLRHSADRIPHQGVFTNTTPVDAYRGAGKPEANYLIERCIDIAAAELGMDALKLRRKNIFRRFPHRSRWGFRSSRAALPPRSIGRSPPRRDSRPAGKARAQARQAARPRLCLLSRNRARPAQ